MQILQQEIVFFVLLLGPPQTHLHLHLPALVYLLHLALEALDRGGCYLRLFFANFKKGFDLIDHLILMENLSTQYNLHWSLLRWVASFLQGRAQVTRVGASVSTPLYLNGGIPQGTKLGPVLFAVMVNDLVQSWGARIKFVDDLTVWGNSQN